MRQDLAARPFSGRVLGVFNRACNLIDDTRQRLIALVLPEVGNGPFAVVVPGLPGLFDSLEPGLPVQGNRHHLSAGSWRISLQDAKVWEPVLPAPSAPPNPDYVLEAVAPYAGWSSFDETTEAGKRTAQLARQSAGQLVRAIAGPKPGPALETAVAQLAGLGGGLTPAGDDYLLGVMAALWLTGQPALSTRMVKIARPRTHALSRAFLEAAARGQFIEPWHALARAWFAGNRQAIAAAVGQIARFGATSGVDALAGFAQTVRNLAKNSILSGK